jgi:phosphoesterase family protein
MLPPLNSNKRGGHHHGTRIPLLVISPYVILGSVDHAYSDHGAILKFIEANWGLRPLSPRSRDNLPTPISSRESPYIPSNGPALGDLMIHGNLLLEVRVIVA